VSGTVGQRVEILSIEGVSTDTNASTIAAAAALAVWRALDFTPPPEVFERIDQVILRGWGSPFTAPDFGD